MNGYTARKQADGEKDRHVKHLLWRRSAKAFAHIKEVGNDKDGEDRGLGHNEVVHSQAPARRGSPSQFRFKCCDCGYAHRNLPLLILPIRIFWMFEVPKRTTALDCWNHG